MSELSDEFRAAIVAAQLDRVLPEANTCDWCGRDLCTIDDHEMIDRQAMCNPCHDEMER